MPALAHADSVELSVRRSAVAEAPSFGHRSTATQQTVASARRNPSSRDDDNIGDANDAAPSRPDRFAAAGDRPHVLSSALMLERTGVSTPLESRGV